MGVELAVAHGRFGIGEMGDQRVDGGPVLGGVDLGDGARIGRVRAKAVDRFGGEGHQVAGRERRRARLDAGAIVHVQNARLLHRAGRPIGKMMCFHPPPPGATVVFSGAALS